MIFSEIYSLYYKAVSRILALSVEGKLTEKDLYAISRENAFPESAMTIVPALRNKEWPLLTDDLHTPLERAPRLPLSTLEKRWLKAVLSDPRVSLFAPEMKGLEETEPLFDLQDIVCFDRYRDGDPFTNERYRARFRTIWKALKEKKLLHLEFISGKGNTVSGTCLPLKLEYSDTDDKFRLLALKEGEIRTINLGRITRAEIGNPAPDSAIPDEPSPKRNTVFIITDERNALQRVLMQFSHYKKEAEKLDEKHVKVTFTYDQDEEIDLTIQLLSFGRFIEVLSPDSIRKNIRERIEKQIQFFNN